MKEEKKIQTSCLFKVVKPWEIDLELPEYRWAKFFIGDSKLPSFVFDKPQPLMEKRIEFIVRQLCTKNRKWIVCFCDSPTYIRTLNFHVLASFVASTKLSAEIAIPKDLIEFTFSKHIDEFIQEPSIQTCSLLIFPSFDFLYPGYQKAKSKITELLTNRKIKKLPFMFSIFTDKLPVNNSDISKYSAQLVDYFGKQAKDLFSDNAVKFIVLKGNDK